MSKKIIATLLALIIIVFSFASCKKDVEDPYIIDEEGQTQKAEKDENGDYFITDEEGNTTYVDKDEVVVKNDKEDEKLSEFVENAEKNPEQVFDEADKDDKLEMSDELVTENVVVVEPDKGEANAKLRLDSYKKIIGTNKFTIEATVKEVGTDNLEYPFTYIRNGNGAYIETAVPFEEGKVVKANMIIVDGKTYCEIPSLKCYMIVDDMSIEDLADGTFDKNSIDVYKFVESGTVTLNGKKYTCDVYEYDTDTIKYYYNSKGEIVRIEKINSRESVITEIKSLKNTADNSKIKKPKGINITSLVS